MFGRVMADVPVIFRVTSPPKEYDYGPLCASKLFELAVATCNGTVPLNPQRIAGSRPVDAESLLR